MKQDSNAMTFQFTASEVRDAFVDYLQKVNPGVGLPEYEKWEITFRGYPLQSPLTLELKGAK